MTTIHHLTNKAIAVTGLPEGAHDFEVKKTGTDKVDQLYYQVKDKIYITNQRLELLPVGNWRILGRAADLTKDDWKRVVEEITFKSNIIKSYRNYERPMPQWIYACSTTTASGHSLLKSKGLHVTNPYGSKPQPFSYVKWEVQARAEQEWQSAQLISNPLILIQ